MLFGLPRGCYSMRCAVVFSDQLTSQRLQRWAGAQLLQLPALPPLSPRLLSHWCACGLGGVTRTGGHAEAASQPGALATCLYRALLFPRHKQASCLSLRLQVPCAA